MRLLTRFTEQFNCRIPILGAPMAGFAGGELAYATWRGGGVGFIAAGHLAEDGQDALDKEVEIFRSRTRTPPLCLGFIGHGAMKNGNLSKVRRVIEKYQPFAVQFFAPAVCGDNVKLAQDLGCLVVAQVGCEKDAREAIEAGVDCIMAQGREAGGHGLQTQLATATMPLATTVADMVREVYADRLHERPSVIAAGGISDGRGLAAALALGCDGAVFGTRLCASQEAMGHQSYKDRLVQATSEDAGRTRTFDIIQNTYAAYPWPEPFDSCGCLKNKTTAEWDDRLDDLTQSLGRSTELAVSYKSAHMAGDADVGLVHAGEGVGLINKIEPAQAIIERAGEDAIRAIQSSASCIVSSST